MSEEEVTRTLAEYLDNKNLDISNEFYNAIVFLRDKYFKLEKAYRKLQAFYEKDYISKDKIRDKIKELEEILEYAITEEGMAEIDRVEYEDTETKIKILEELLGDE